MTQTDLQPKAENPFDWYKPGKSIAEFHQSKARTRALIGARGSGKTTGWAVEALGHTNPLAVIFHGLPSPNLLVLLQVP